MNVDVRPNRLTRKMVDAILDTGGFTLDSQGYSRESGYVVGSGHDGSRVVIPWERFKERPFGYIENWRYRAGVLDQVKNGAFYGGWHDNESGLVFLETSRIYQTEDDAMSAARECGQRAVYCLHTGETLYTAERIKGNH